MPLVTIDLLEGRTPEELDAISGAVHDSMVEVLDVPTRDRFQSITEHRASTLRFDPSYLGIERDEGFILVRITLGNGRSTDTKRAFYSRLSQLLAQRADVRPDERHRRDDGEQPRGLVLRKRPGQLPRTPARSVEMIRALPVSCGTGALQPRQRNRVCIRPHGQFTARFAFGDEWGGPAASLRRCVGQPRWHDGA